MKRSLDHEELVAGVSGQDPLLGLSLGHSVSAEYIASEALLAETALTTSTTNNADSGVGSVADNEISETIDRIQSGDESDPEKDPDLTHTTKKPKLEDSDSNQLQSPVSEMMSAAVTVVPIAAGGAGEAEPQSIQLHTLESTYATSPKQELLAESVPAHSTVASVPAVTESPVAQLASQPLTQPDVPQQQVAPAPPPQPQSLSTATYTPTALDLHQLKYCSQSLARLKRLKDAPPFLHPVDPVKLGIPTYFTIVTHPMDISTIQKKLDTGAYTSAHGFVDDLNLMFENCWRFNGRESLVGLMAVRLQAYMQTQLEKMPMTVDKKPARPSSGYHAAAVPPAALDRPKRDVQPPTRISSEPNGLSPNRRPPTKQALAELKYAASVTREMMKPKYYAFNFPFLEPVDHVKLNIPTYPLLIKHPMDMGTILKKLERGDCYSSGVEFEADMRLVFRNCYTFNAPGSEVHEMGRKLEQLFELKWRERPIVGMGGVTGAGGYLPAKRGSFSAAADESDDSSSSEDEGQDLNKMQENLLKLMQEVTKLAAHKGNKEKKKHKKSGSKMHAMLLQQQILAAATGGALPNAASLLSATSSSSSITSGPVASAPKKKKKSSHSRSKASATPIAAPIKDITYQQKKELSEKIEDLPPEKLEYVYQIIRSGMPNLDAAGQDEIELDIDSLDKVTLSKLYHFVVSAVKSGSRAPSSSSAPPTAAPPKSITQASRADSSDSDSSGSDSDSGSSGSSSSPLSKGGDSDAESQISFVGGGEEIRDDDLDADLMEVDVLPVVASATSELASASASVDPLVAPALIVGPRTGAGPLKMPSAPIAKLLAPPKPAAAKAAASKVFIAHASATGKAATPTLVTTASGATPTLIAPRLGSTPNLVGPSRAAASSSQSLGSDAAKRVDSKYPQFKKAPVKQAPAAPPKPAQVDVFDLMDSLKEKEKREEAAKRERREREDAARRERDREERRVAEQQRGGADLRQLASTGRPRDTSSYHTRDSPRDARSPPVVQSPLDSVPSPAQRAKEYALSIEKYAGKWVDLHRQGTVMIEFEKTLKGESTPKFEAALAKERADLVADLFQVAP